MTVLYQGIEVHNVYNWLYHDRLYTVRLKIRISHAEGFRMLNLCLFIKYMYTQSFLMGPKAPSYGNTITSWSPGLVDLSLRRCFLPDVTQRHRRMHT